MFGGGQAKSKHVTDLESTVAKARSEEHTSELQSLAYLVCRLLLEKKKKKKDLISQKNNTELKTLAYIVLRFLFEKKKNHKLSMPFLCNISEVETIRTRQSNMICSSS